MKAARRSRSWPGDRPRPRPASARYTLAEDAEELLAALRVHRLALAGAIGAGANVLDQALGPHRGLLLEHAAAMERLAATVARHARRRARQGS